MKKVLIYSIYLVVLVFLATESGLRIKGTYKTYSERTSGKYVSEFGKKKDRYHNYRPGRKFTMDRGEFKHDYSINSLGFREREFSEVENSGLRVLVFGDSFAEGVGAPSDSTWPGLFENLLVYYGLEAEVYNAGSSGADPFYNLISLKELFLEQKPSHVIFQVNSSDISDIAIRGGMERFVGKNRVQYREAPWFHFFFRYSHMARFYLIEVKGFDYSLLKSGEWEDLQDGAMFKLNNCLQQADSICRANKIQFLVLTHPFPNELCGRLADDQYFSPILESLENGLSGFSVINLSPYFESFTDPEKCAGIFWPVDQHFNGIGYEMFAAAVYRAILDQNPDFWLTDQSKTY